MRSLLPLAVYCISLLFLQQQLLALPAEERPDRNSWDLLNKLVDQRKDKASASESQTSIVSPSSARSPTPTWLLDFLRHQPVSGVRTDLANLAWAQPPKVSPIKKRVLRVRRHAHSGSRNHHYHHQGQLMRVGCVLGTCQVQNLSHRLYQLIGQSGREDSSPINPRSPHSYG